MSRVPAVPDPAGVGSDGGAATEAVRGPAGQRAAPAAAGPGRRTTDGADRRQTPRERLAGGGRCGQI